MLQKDIYDRKIDMLLKDRYVIERYICYRKIRYVIERYICYRKINMLQKDRYVIEGQI